MEINFNKKFKTGALVLLLSAPVFVLSVLYFFGDNYFDVPKFYCEIDSCYSILNLSKRPIIYLLENDEDYKNRIKGLFPDVAVHLDLSDSTQNILRVKDYTENLTTAILVDNNGVIRGYYNLANSDEKERLIIELEIIKVNSK